MGPAAVGPVLPLALLGALLAGGCALLLSRLARRGAGPAVIRLVFLAGLLAACLLPFGWVALLGRTGP